MGLLLTVCSEAQASSGPPLGTSEELRRPWLPAAPSSQLEELPFDLFYLIGLLHNILWQRKKCLKVLHFLKVCTQNLRPWYSGKGMMGILFRAKEKERKGKTADIYRVLGTSHCFQLFLT